MKNNFSYFLEEKEKLSFFTFPKLRNIDSIVYGFTTKNWTKRALIENLNLNDFSIIYMNQIHSDKFHLLKEVPGEILVGDALITTIPKILLTIKTADCLPILIFDKEAKVVSAIHVGWKGVIRKFTKKVVLEIVDSLDIKPSSLFALLGPCICSKCYEVGEDVKEILEKEWDSFTDLLIPSHKEGKYQLDLRKANTIQLKEMGLKQENIFNIKLCTKCNPKLFFSHRRKPINKDRMISFIGFEK
ncbi:MAG: peptidoglycan editing factor PgeF [Candidatus Humimicrobiia bacterium]